MNFIKENKILIISIIVIIALIINNISGYLQIQEVKAKLEIKSEIELIKENYDNNKKQIVVNKEELTKITTKYENSVWLDRCLEKKLVDIKVNCTDNLKRFAVFK